MNPHQNISRRLHRMGMLLCALLGMVLVAGCSSETEDISVSRDGTDRPLHAGFRLTVSDRAGGSGTRAAGYLGDGYDRGEGFENYIDLPGKDYRFLFFDQETNTFIAPLTVTSVIPLESTVTSKTYEVLGSVSDIIRDKALKLVALANWKTYPGDKDLKPGVTTIEDICAQVYDFTPAKAQLSETNTIPLYGVRTLGKLVWDANNYSGLGTLHLLRAYAKVEVTVDPGNEWEWGLESVTLHRYNTKGYCAPTGIYTQDSYVHGNYEADYVDGIHIPADCGTEADMPFTRTAENTFVTYIPEYKNTGREPEEQAAIIVKFRGSNAILQPVYFKDYAAENTPAFDIRRNYWYRFHVRKVTPDNADIKVELDVIPYLGVELNPDFGFDDLLPKPMPEPDPDPDPDIVV